MRRASCICVHLFIILDDKAKATATCSKKYFTYVRLNKCFANCPWPWTPVTYHIVSILFSLLAVAVHWNLIHCWCLFANENNNVTRYVINKNRRQKSRSKTKPLKVCFLFCKESLKGKKTDNNYFIYLFLSFYCNFNFK